MNPNKPVKRTIDLNSLLVSQTDKRGNQQVIGEIHVSPAGRFKVIMAGKAIAKSIKDFDEAQKIALGWAPEDCTYEAVVLHSILEGHS